MILRAIIAILALLLGAFNPAISTAQTAFTCADFLTQTAAQNHLDRFPDDPYGLDPDGDGIACEDMQTSGDANVAIAQEADIDCTDFVLPQMAQAELDKNSSDPYGLDPDGNGIACDELTAGSDAIPPGSVAPVGDTPQGPLDARLGGTIESWEHAFGTPLESEGEQEEIVEEYDVPGFSGVHAGAHLGRIETIRVFAPRPASVDWTDESHEMNWSAVEAHDVARAFLPRDATIGTIRQDASGFVQTECASAALATEVSQELYDYVDDSPQYGGCSYSLFYVPTDDSREISWIDVSLQIEEPNYSGETIAAPANRETASAVYLQEGANSSENSDQALAGPTLEEQAYTREMVPLLVTMTTSLDSASTLFSSPRFGDQDWIISVAVELVTWQQSYEDALAITPPASMAEIHYLIVEAFRLHSDASTDIATGIDTFNPALLEQALDKMNRGAALMRQANELIKEFQRERGG